MVGSATMTALCAFILSPVLYILVVGAILVLAIIGGSFAAAIAISRDGDILDYYCAGEIIRGGFELAGAILAGLASACRSSN